MERGCHQPRKNKELVFFLVRKSVNRGDPAVLRCIELMNVLDIKVYFGHTSEKLKYEKVYLANEKKKKKKKQKEREKEKFDSIRLKVYVY